MRSKRFEYKSHTNRKVVISRSNQNTAKRFKLQINKKSKKKKKYSFRNDETETEIAVKRKK